MADAEQTLRGVLDTIAAEQNYTDHEIKLKSISSGGANYTSQLYLITLSAPGRDDVKLFAKVAAVSENMRAQAPHKIFDTEMFFYTELLKLYQKIEERHNIPEENRLATAKFYGCNKEYLKEVLVLEDLSARGLDTQNRFKSFDWAYASKSITEIAKFHALSIALSKEHPEEYETLSKKFNIHYAKENFENFLESAVNMSLAVVKDENKDRLAKFMAQLHDLDFDKYIKPIRCSVLAHGDFRPSNIMHKIRENGDVEVIVLDYQMLQIGNPIMDLMYFIFTGSDEEFRAHHYRQLLDHYHSELTNALNRLGVDAQRTYSKDDFEYELQQVQPYGLFISVLMLPMVTVEVENAPKISEITGIDEFIIKPTELTANRLNGVVNDFIKLGYI